MKNNFFPEIAGRKKMRISIVENQTKHRLWIVLTEKTGFPLIFAPSKILSKVFCASAIHTYASFFPNNVYVVFVLRCYQPPPSMLLPLALTDGRCGLHNCPMNDMAIDIIFQPKRSSVAHGLDLATKRNLHSTNDIVISLRKPSRAKVFVTC
ncbi:hypothetical protein T01_630 [Trichinella spiralis]|uniref:Uncharacterized protein n=1 Tax=Trichinella spiralis TaxID=6334 RepID=A0A0V1B4W4_TRISP|nr:hypothetical protein T01_630 [Trichinella spiralis]